MIERCERMQRDPRMTRVSTVFLESLFIMIRSPASNLGSVHPGTREKAAIGEDMSEMIENSVQQQGNGGKFTEACVAAGKIFVARTPVNALLSSAREHIAVDSSQCATEPWNIEDVHIRQHHWEFVPDEPPK